MPPGAKLIQSLSLIPPKRNALSEFIVTLHYFVLLEFVSRIWLSEAIEPDTERHDRNDWLATRSYWSDHSTPLSSQPKAAPISAIRLCTSSFS